MSSLSNLLTNSRLKCERRCKRLHHIQYDLGYRPADDPDETAFGTLLHLGLEVWWNALWAWQRSGAVANPSDWVLAAAARVRAAKVDPFDEARAIAMLGGYHTRWLELANDYEVLGVEERFDVPLVNPETGRPSPMWRLGGKIDVRVRRRRDGALGYVEHKSSGENISRGSFYWLRLLMDTQVSTYFDGTVSLSDGELPQFCLYDVLGKPAIRPSKVPLLDEHGNKVVLDAKGERVRVGGGKWRQTGDTQQGYVLQSRAETAPEYFKRCMEKIEEDLDSFFVRNEVVRLEAEMAEARLELWQQAASMRENANAGRYPRDPEACAAYGRPCSYFGVCTGTASLDDSRLFIRSTNPHPELAGIPTSATQEA